MITVWGLEPYDNNGKKRMSVTSKVLIFSISITIGSILLCFGCMFILGDPMILMLLLVPLTAAIIGGCLAVRSKTQKHFQVFVEENGVFYFVHFYNYSGRYNALNAARASERDAQLALQIKTIRDVYYLGSGVDLFQIEKVEQIYDCSSSYRISCWVRPIEASNDMPVLSSKRKNKGIDVAKDVRNVEQLIYRLSMFMQGRPMNSNATPPQPRPTNSSYTPSRQRPANPQYMPPQGRPTSSNSLPPQQQRPTNLPPATRPRGQAPQRPMSEQERQKWSR